ncbi:MAG: hypothetical protein HXX81_04340 [Campylobacterales bacterium]|nr:hypothetical protein [Campylobacterales bacterium]
MFKVAFTDLATSIYIVHNHPSGELNPSKADIELTKKLIEISKILEIRVNDHIIISKKGYFSFLENNLM